MPRVTITLPEKNAQPYRFQLERKVVSLGRGSDNDIVIDSESVSGKHAEMQRVDGGYVLTDLGSTNGIKLDEVRQQKIPLISGMTVKLGDVAFDFSLSEEELELLSHEAPAYPEPSDPAPLPDLPEAAPSEPKRERAPKQRARAAEPSNDGPGSGMVWLFIILAAAAFFTGLSVRHQKETGESLIKAIVNKSELKKEGAEETETPPAEEETTEEVE